MFKGEDINELRRELLRDHLCRSKYVKRNKLELDRIDPDDATPLQLFEKSIAANLPQYVPGSLKRYKSK